MVMTKLPSDARMYRAFLDRDGAFDGVFVTAVRTTGIFCRPTCSARRPRRENCEFFSCARDALAAGYRPCLRCRPMEPRGAAPEWLRPLLAEVERDPARRWTEQDLRDRGLDPIRVRRWFKANHGMTFHAYQRARRLGLALANIGRGADLTEAAYDHGYESPSAFRDAFAKVFGAAPGRSRVATLVVTARLTSPLGPMVAAATEEGVCMLEFADRPMLPTQIARLQERIGAKFAPGRNERLARLEAELEEYFAGKRRAFSVPLIAPGTEFQRAVWSALRRVPCGETRSYEWLAGEVGRPNAVRAVGLANGANRIGILIPCHRIVGKDGRLVGYGGGLWRKEALLRLEGAGAKAQGRSKIS